MVIKRFFLLVSVLCIVFGLYSFAYAAGGPYELTDDVSLFSGGVSLLSVVDPVTPANTNGLKQIMVDLIGDYEAVIVEYSYVNNNGTTSYVREIQPDYVWLCSCAVFLVVLYCVIRLGAAILCKR